ncbi:MAG: hypothetical protein KDB07_07385 [Planctomycetes bacterium]|nr:hypothetical protein [Planctomycetota bacterium]
MTLWNTTKAFGRPKNVTLYGKTIRPGLKRDVDANWVFQYPHVLQLAVSRREVHMGGALPQWYHQALKEKKMKRIKNPTTTPVTLRAEGSDPVMLKPGEHCHAPDVLADAMVAGADVDLEVEKVGDDSKPEEPPKDQPEEEAVEDPEPTEGHSADEPDDDDPSEADEASEDGGDTSTSAKDAAMAKTNPRRRRNKK